MKSWKENDAVGTTDGFPHPLFLWWLAGFKVCGENRSTEPWIAFLCSLEDASSYEDPSEG